ncbi:recombinase family protein [Chitinophaga terrae (ex Kim and Jung 2007)]|nr:recombinase family protein [Chitinophaga terrae (ex Kim and Jung 2007)]
MRKNVIIYTRVSTDEQARSGYSLNHQELAIKTYCNLKGYNIVQIIREDHSAKTFDRPEWLKLIAFLKANKNQVDTILFLRWDRFTRNAEEALKVIRELGSWGITVDATEQPLDLSIPENKVLLALYLTIPEVENDKNAIRTKEASRRSRQEGFWTGTPPFGYDNFRDVNEKSTLVPNDKAALVKEAFDLMATGVYSAEEVRKKLKPKGIYQGKQAFLNLLRNVAYIGKIHIAEYKKEAAYDVIGAHPAIVDEGTFNTVQDILKGKKPNFNFGLNRTNTYPLRQYLKCPKCGGGLTASGSRSRNKQIYHYYHCINNSCKIRYGTDGIHSDFDSFLRSLVVPEEITELYQHILEDVFKKDDLERLKAIQDLQGKITLIQKRIKKVEDDYFDERLPIAEYVAIKERYTSEMATLNKEITDKKMEKTPFKKYLSFGLSVVGNIQHYYDQAPLEVKQKLIGSIFPGKLTYENNSFRTGQVNEVFQLITSNNKVFQATKNKKVGKIADQSSMAPPAGLEPATL